MDCGPAVAAILRSLQRLQSLPARACLRAAHCEDFADRLCGETFAPFIFACGRRCAAIAGILGFVAASYALMTLAGRFRERNSMKSCQPANADHEPATLAIACRTQARVVPGAASCILHELLATSRAAWGLAGSEHVMEGGS
jgi:hypothetical protein